MRYPWRLCWWESWHPLSLTGSKPASGSTKVFSGKEGFLFTAILPLLLLALLALGGTLRVVKLSQQRIAMQSRLDICAAKLVEARLKTERVIENTNPTLEASYWAVAAARGLVVIGPVVGSLAALGQKALVQLNRSLAVAQESALAAGKLQELRLSLCSPTPFSREAVFCEMHPQLEKLHRRKTSVFGDLRRSLETLGKETGVARCQARNLVSEQKISAFEGGKRVYAK